MILQEKTWQNRFDFHGIFICEFCGSEQKEEHCYDDDYYHNTVIPTKVRCNNCGETTKSGKENGTASFQAVSLSLSLASFELIKELESHYQFSERVGGRAKLLEQALRLYNFYYHEVETMKKKLFTGYSPGSAEEIKITNNKVELVREEEVV